MASLVPAVPAGVLMGGANGTFGAIQATSKPTGPDSSTVLSEYFAIGSPTMTDPTYYPEQSIATLQSHRAFANQAANSKMLAATLQEMAIQNGQALYPQLLSVLMTLLLEGAMHHLHFHSAPAARVMEFGQAPTLQSSFSTEYYKVDRSMMSLKMSLDALKDPVKGPVLVTALIAALSMSFVLSAEMDCLMAIEAAAMQSQRNSAILKAHQEQRMGSSHFDRVVDAYIDSEITLFGMCHSHQYGSVNALVEKVVATVNSRSKQKCNIVLVPRGVKGLYTFGVHLERTYYFMAGPAGPELLRNGLPALLIASGAYVLEVGTVISSDGFDYVPLVDHTTAGEYFALWEGDVQTMKTVPDSFTIRDYVEQRYAKLSVEDALRNSGQFDNGGKLTIRDEQWDGKTYPSVFHRISDDGRGLLKVLVVGQVEEDNLKTKDVVNIAERMFSTLKDSVTLQSRYAAAKGLYYEMANAPQNTEWETMIASALDAAVNDGKIIPNAMYSIDLPETARMINRPVNPGPFYGTNFNGWRVVATFGEQHGFVECARRCRDAVSLIQELAVICRDTFPNSKFITTDVNVDENVDEDTKICSSLFSLLFGPQIPLYYASRGVSSTTSGVRMSFVSAVEKSALIGNKSEASLLRAAEFGKICSAIVNVAGDVHHEDETSRWGFITADNNNSGYTDARDEIVEMLTNILAGTEVDSLTKTGNEMCDVVNIAYNLANVVAYLSFALFYTTYRPTTLKSLRLASPETVGIIMKLIPIAMNSILHDFLLSIAVNMQNEDFSISNYFSQYRSFVNYEPVTQELVDEMKRQLNLQNPGDGTIFATVQTLNCPKAIEESQWPGLFDKIQGQATRLFAMLRAKRFVIPDKAKVGHGDSAEEIAIVQVFSPKNPAYSIVKAIAETEGDEDIEIKSETLRRWFNDDSLNEVRGVWEQEMDDGETTLFSYVKDGAKKEAKDYVAFAAFLKELIDFLVSQEVKIDPPPKPTRVPVRPNAKNTDKSATTTLPTSNYIKTPLTVSENWVRTTKSMNIFAPEDRSGPAANYAAQFKDYNDKALVEETTDRWRGAAQSFHGQIETQTLSQRVEEAYKLTRNPIVRLFVLLYLYSKVELDTFTALSRRGVGIGFGVLVFRFLEFETQKIIGMVGGNATGATLMREPLAVIGVDSDIQGVTYTISMWHKAVVFVAINVFAFMNAFITKINRGGSRWVNLTGGSSDEVGDLYSVIVPNETARRPAPVCHNAITISGVNVRTVAKHILQTGSADLLENQHGEPNYTGAKFLLEKIKSNNVDHIGPKRMAHSHAATHETHVNTTLPCFSASMERGDAYVPGTGHARNLGPTFNSSDGTANSLRQAAMA